MKKETEWRDMRIAERIIEYEKMGFLTFKPSYPGVPGKPLSPYHKQRVSKKISFNVI